MNLPEAFVERIKNDSFLNNDLLDALNTTSPVSVRLNPFKTKAGLNFSSHVPWCENAFYLESRPQYVLDPLFHAGAYYPQEAGSMTIDSVLRQLDLPEDPKVLDLCASPGGKSTLIQSFIGTNGYLVSNEVIGSRAKVLRENMVKWGFHNSIVTNNDPEDFQRIPDWFDLVLIDAPCSGEGMFRKDPQARNEWNAESPAFCAARQRRIVTDAWETLKPGGFLIYSTCTFNSDENEDNVQWFTDTMHAEIIELNFPEGIINGRKNLGYYCLPNKVATEGFYLAVLQKQDGAQTNFKSKTSKGLSHIKPNPEIEEFCSTDGIEFFTWNDIPLAFPEKFADDFNHLQQQLRILKMGTRVGESAKKGIIPSEEIALNPHLRKIHKQLELPLNETLKFLRGETFPVDAPLGFVAITFENEPLGWIKNIGNRFNNQYPKEWRIRMQI